MYPTWTEEDNFGNGYGPPRTVIPEEEEYSALPTRTSMYAYFHQFFLRSGLLVSEAS